MNKNDENNNHDYGYKKEDTIANQEDSRHIA